MTDKQYTIRAAQLKGLSIIKPTKGNPGILALNFNIKPAPCVIDAQTWAEARTQINNYFKA